MKKNIFVLGFIVFLFVSCPSPFRDTTPHSADFYFYNYTEKDIQVLVWLKDDSKVKAKTNNNIQLSANGTASFSESQFSLAWVQGNYTASASDKKHKIPYNCYVSLIDENEKYLDNNVARVQIREIINGLKDNQKVVLTAFKTFVNPVLSLSDYDNIVEKITDDDDKKIFTDIYDKDYTRVRMKTCIACKDSSLLYESVIKNIETVAKKYSLFDESKDYYYVVAGIPEK